MKPKDRVLAAFGHAIPDRVPINYLYNRPSMPGSKLISASNE
jgi:hypothetical protein